MRLGLFLISPQWPGRTHGEALAESVRLAHLAEEVGLDEVWLAEHHFMSYGVCPSAITLAGHLLGATGRIGVGTAVSVLPSTHPVALAEQAAMLDQLTPGRLRLGVGRGGPWRELSVLGGGEDAGRRRWEHGFAEELDVLRTALRAPAVHGPGPLVPFDEVPVVPRPAAPGGPPLHVAATSPATVAVAGTRRLPLLLGMHAGDDEKAAALAHWTEHAGTADPDPAEHVAVGIAHVADTRVEAQRAVREALPRWLRPGLAGYVRADGAPRTPTDVDAYTDLLCRLHAVGTVDDARERLETTRARTGIDRMALMVQTTGDPGRTTETVTALGELLGSRAAPATG
ncbi:LLM class flavin-dependent oxidoreductase [Actinomycetospora sp. NBC_00405]|uniref:LLM class flavin-dependent oxidoreductase n=1 Tax=Actinomycetospora sp. NBC_00405 TaxID=2975952 RepID=UPI002E1C427B